MWLVCVQGPQEGQDRRDGTASLFCSWLCSRPGSLASFFKTLPSACYFLGATPPVDSFCYCGLFMYSHYLLEPLERLGSRDCDSAWKNRPFLCVPTQVSQGGLVRNCLFFFIQQVLKPRAVKISSPVNLIVFE